MTILEEIITTSFQCGMYNTAKIGENLKTWRSFAFKLLFMFFTFSLPSSEAPTKVRYVYKCAEVVYESKMIQKPTV